MLLTVRNNLESTMKNGVQYDVSERNAIPFTQTVAPAIM
jgi:hypothetical protein